MSSKARDRLEGPHDPVRARGGLGVDRADDGLGLPRAARGACARAAPCRRRRNAGTAAPPL